MTRLTIGGLDLSLTSTGIAVLELSETPLWRTLTLGEDGKKTDTLPIRQKRLHRLAHGIVQELLHVDLLAVEEKPYGARHGSSHDRSGLAWLVLDELMQIGVPVCEVNSSKRRKYACGNGNADKGEVMAAAIKRYPDADIRKDDIADAVVIAAMAARYLGQPVESSLPKAHLDAMDGVLWPTVPIETVPLAGAAL